MVQNTLSEAMKSFETKHGYSEKHAAAIVGIPRTTWIRYKNDPVSRPSGQNLSLIANALNIPLVDVLAMATNYTENKKDPPVGE